MYNPKQGDIVFLDFSPQSGHEQAGRRNTFPLHIPLDNRTKTTGVILTEHIKCLDVVSRNIQFIEKKPEDLLEKTLAYVKGFF